MDTPELASYADVTPLDQEWLWEGRIPFGEVTLIGGDSGIGKGFLMSDLAARVSRGDVMPDGTPGPPPSHVIMITAEDDPACSTVHRLRAARADLSNVHDLTVVNGNIFCIQDDIAVLRAGITAAGGAALVVMDPISAVTNVGLTSDVPVRRKVWGPLQAVARDTGCAIVVIGHFTKSGAKEVQRNRAAAKDGLGGTKGLTNAARMMLSVVRDETDPRIRTLAVVKSNVASDAEASPVRYQLAGVWPDTHVAYMAIAGSDLAGAEAGCGQDVLLGAVQSAGTVLTGRELAVLTGIEYSTARVLLSRLVAKGLVVSPARGQFAAAESVTSAGQDPDSGDGVAGNVVRPAWPRTGWQEAQL